jgi:competence protein ComEC
MSWLALAGISAFALGVAVASLCPVAWPLACLPLILGGLFVWAFVRARRIAYASFAIVFLCSSFGMLRMLAVPQAIPEALLPLFGAKVELEGRIVADPDIRESTQRITIEMQYGGAATRLIAVAPLYPEHAYGERVRVSGTLARPEAFATDGGREFDYPRFLAKDGVFALVERASAETLAPPAGFFARAQGALYAGKHAFMRGLARALPEPAAGLAAGILAGGKQGLGDELLDAFTVAGLLPVVVLSGYNVMIVAETLLMLLGGLPNASRFPLAGMAMALFVLAAGGGASALRALLMACLALYARATGRTYDALRALVAVFFAMILLNPLSLLFDPGLQFSCLATLGLILGTPIATGWFGWIKNGMIRETLASTVAAQAMVLPLLLYQTGNLSLVAVPANLLVLPTMPLAMLLSAIAGAAGILLPALAPALGLPAYLVLEWTIFIAEQSARLPLASVILPAFPFWMAACAYACMALWLVRAQRERARSSGSGRVLG